MIPEGYLAFRDALEGVIDPRYYTIGWLDWKIISGKYKFWRGDRSGIITEIREYPTGAKDIHCIIAAGDMNEIIHDLAPQAEAYGREQGCIASIVESREGWARALAPSGYVIHQVAIRKGL